jgi:lysozyme family protein
MSIDVAKEIYLNNYWLPLGCDKLIHLGICTILFNSGTLYGVKKATLFAQYAANNLGMSLKTDGVFGDKTIDAINSLEPSDFIDKYHEQIMARIDDVCEVNPKNEKYRKGWTKRADRLLSLVNVSLDKIV